MSWAENGTSEELRSIKLHCKPMRCHSRGSWAGRRGRLLFSPLPSFTGRSGAVCFSLHFVCCILRSKWHYRGQWVTLSSIASPLTGGPIERTPGRLSCVIGDNFSFVTVIGAMLWNEFLTPGKAGTEFTKSCQAGAFYDITGQEGIAWFWLQVYWPCHYSLRIWKVKNRSELVQAMW